MRCSPTSPGRNGGHLTEVSVHGFRRRVDRHGKDEALRDVRIERHTVLSILELLDKSPSAARNVDLVKGGRLNILFSSKEVETARADIAAASEAGLDLTGVEWLEPDVTEQRFRVRLPAVFSPGNTIWPLKLVTKLFESAKGTTTPDPWFGKTSSLLARTTSSAFSLDLFTQTPVDAIESVPSGGAYSSMVKTNRGSIQTRYVMHATNALSRPLVQEEDRALVILGGGRETVANHEFNVADDSVVNSAISKILRSFLPTLFPKDFDESEPEMEWTGIMGFTRSGDPMVNFML
ncbi:hypothetical protein FRC07_012777 [Ceratobasidium sp. 392]|nr:hypothetical protein FRC07_012777 [Ceratobasidium sp. 392]